MPEDLARAASPGVGNAGTTTPASRRKMGSTLDERRNLLAAHDAKLGKKASAWAKRAAAGAGPGGKRSDAVEDDSTVGNTYHYLVRGKS